MNDIDLLNVDLNLLKAFDALVERPLSSHAYPPLLAKPDRHLVLNPRQTIARGQFFGSGFELVKHIDAFVSNYNQTVRPFVWIIPGSSEPR
jgi:hypothetical protein